MNYHDEMPTKYANITAEGIVNYFSDISTSQEERAWFVDLLRNPKAMRSDGARNWNYIRAAFAEKYNIPITTKKISVTSRLGELFPELNK